MSVGDCTPGRRLPDGRPADRVAPWMQPGDYWKDEHGGWWIRPPRGGTGRLEVHDIIEHADGTISVSPSILLDGEIRWHGMLEHGVWREV